MKKLCFCAGFVSGFFESVGLIKIQKFIYRKSAKFSFSDTINGFDCFYDVIG